MARDIRVLIVDDSLLGRASVKRILNNLGISKVFEAEDGKPALKLLCENKPDLMILDLLMPEMDGFQVLEEKQKIDGHCDVIVLSSDIQDVTEQRCNELGARFFLNKPIREASLKAILESLYGQEE